MMGSLPISTGWRWPAHNAPQNPRFDATALLERGLESAVEELIDLQSYAHLVRQGANVLAVHALNNALKSPSFLCWLELRDEDRGVSPTQAGYLMEPSPGKINDCDLERASPCAANRCGQFFFEDLEVAFAPKDPETSIYFTTDGRPRSSDWNALPGAFHDWENHHSQSRRPARRLEAFFGNHSQLPIPTRHRDPVGLLGNREAFSRPLGGTTRGLWNGPKGGGSQSTGCLSWPLCRFYSGGSACHSKPFAGHGSGRLVWGQGIYANPTARSSAWDAWERAVSVEWLDPDRAEGFQIDAGIKIQGGAFRNFGLTLKNPSA